MGKNTSNIETSTGVSVFTGDAKKAEALLKKHSNAIIKAENAGKQALINIAGNLYQIASTECFKLDGYKGIGDYSEKVFGYTKGTTSDMVKVAKLFLQAHNKEMTSFVPVLPAIDNKPWTVGQLKELTRIDVDVAKGLVDDGVINSGMTTKSLREVVQGLVEDKSSDETTEADGEETTDSSKSSKKDEPTIDGQKVSEMDKETVATCKAIMKKVGMLWAEIPEKKRKNKKNETLLLDIKVMLQEFCKATIDDDDDDDGFDDDTVEETPFE